MHGVGSLPSVPPVDAGVLSQAGCSGCRWPLLFLPSTGTQMQGVENSQQGVLKLGPLMRTHYLLFLLPPPPCFPSFKVESTW